ncbi:hypothetical protein C8R44DRAFT_981504 [Mycena epipterygia]|nr:hypothetical protein C8R44DRAFT_981504 [Mycena epipterygia]
MVYNLKALTLAALALAITPALGQLSLACNTGETTGSCSDFITTFCTSIANQVIPPNSSAQRCFTVSAGTSVCDFRALNTGTTNTSISVPNCEQALTVVGEVCAEGGWGQVGPGFKFWGNPDTGVCAGVCGN